MHYLRYRVKTCAPVIISEISGDMNIIKTEKYMPGTSVLGMLAKRFIEKCSDGLAHKNESFYNWFLVGNLKIGNAYIMSQDDYGEYTHYPTPFSIEKEKYGANVYDCLFTDTEDIEDTQYVGDFCDLEDSFLIKKVETGIEFHHARDREKGISEKGIIFNYESIGPNQTFSGEIKGRKDDLQKLLQCCSTKWDAFIGRSKNAQYGAVEFEFIDRAPLPLETQIFMAEDEEDQQQQLVSMTLRSDLILYNELGYPTTDVDDLELTMKNCLGELEIKKAFVKTKEIENFVSVWRLKKPVGTCFAAGSTFLLKIASEKREKLVAIQESGLGERTHEGFGRCVFGLQIGELLNLIDESEERATKPPEPAPAKTREIMKKIIRDVLRERIELMATNQQAEFARLPSNSLIAKLYALAKNAGGERQKLMADINKLRQIAVGQMRCCVSREYNLLEYLAAYKLDETAIIQLEEMGVVANHKMEAIKKSAKNREFTLIESMSQHIGLKKDDKFEEVEKDAIIKFMKFLYKPVDLNRLLNQPRNIMLRKICEETGYTPETDSELEQKLTDAFYTTFFAAMRRRKIAEDKKDAQ